MQDSSSHAPGPAAINETVEATKRPAHKAPEHIGPYRILEMMGEGGMGEVYKAEQKQPVRRLVALKVIKLGMDTKEVVARFEAERQALALMSHPNVAKVYEAGMTDQGRPYFAMEFVAGIPLTRYCDECRLTTRERLELFIQVCHAVQHAHQKGIIHRDLKPSNILVTHFDGKPVPKVIDFGIAKAANQALTDRTLYTRTGSLIGTPEYMSPEQALTSGLDVDTRTDVYSLGVVLYELLTGALPLDRQTLHQGNLEQMARIIKETEPRKPSTKLGTMASQPPSGGTGSTLAEVAQRRRSDPRSLEREIKGDLDWIVLKAMEKDRTRRYETANALAMDVRRYLDHDLVLARPPSTAYRLSKLLRKHRVAVAAALAIAAALFVGLIGTCFGLLQAQHQRDVARAAQQAERQQRDAADRARQQAESANRFMRDLFGSLSLTPAESRQRLLKAAQRLDDGWLADQPETLAVCRMVMGYGYLEARSYPESEEQFKKGLEASKQPDGRYNPQSAAPSFQGLATLHLVKEQNAEAEQDFLRAVTEFRRLPGASYLTVYPLTQISRLRQRAGDVAGARAARLEALSAQEDEATTAIAASPADGQLVFDRAAYRIRLGRFKDAADDLNRAIALDPSSHWNWYVAACLRLYLGDDRGYREACQQMLDRFGASDQKEIAERTAKTCLLCATPAGDVSRLNALVDRALAPDGPRSYLEWFQMSKGIAEYRAGNLKDAQGWFEKSHSLNDQYAQPTIELFEAMIQHRLGNTTAARASLQGTIQSIDSQLPKPGVDDPGTVENFLILMIVRREAEQLIDGTSPGTHPGPTSAPATSRSIAG